ncbi:uncharacterized protein BXZ73DRAFT_73804 [Epithele typhae]|uniref:uncharacterized protein n=1 Tax=Epithele typhae TaxID=378194 RepID=UPI0020075E59|nr:uncharacterized protein BXZ73DRAFT_73804 [Epithele typhae]KAH9944238.1 hypothetical protein BXZ73DRAFT_73804 [Epithele typhae]
MSTSTLPTGRSDARFETSAAMAETEASTAKLSKEVQQNAAQVHTAAVDAAHTAEEKETRSGTAVERLEEGLSHKTDVAAAQGAADVASLTATATGYVDQAKTLAGNAIAFVQMSSGTASQTEKSVGGANGATNCGVSTTVQTAVATGKEYVASGSYPAAASSWGLSNPRGGGRGGVPGVGHRGDKSSSCNGSHEYHVKS